MHQGIITKYIGVYELCIFYTSTIYLLVELNSLRISYTLHLQKNLDIVNEWSHKWLLKFNPDKYQLLQLGPNSSPTNYYLASPCQMNVAGLLFPG